MHKLHAGSGDSAIRVSLPIGERREVSADAMQQEIVKDVLFAMETDRLELPLLPDMAFNVRKLLSDPDSSTSQFVDLLSTDLTISLYIIKAANSAAFSPGQPVGNLYDAIPRLGFRLLYSMVVNITLTQLFQAKSPLIDRRLRELWAHSQRVAANCYVLALPHKHLKPEDAMLAGLVHDIGALPLYLYTDHRHPEASPAVLDDLIEKFSAPVGARLLRSWRFPDGLVEVAANHGDLRRINSTGKADYVDVVTVANLQLPGAAENVVWKGAYAAERLNYYAGDCRDFLLNHAEQFEAVSDMMGLRMAPTAPN